MSKTLIAVADPALTDCPPLSKEDQSRLVEEYLPLVKCIASRIAGRLPSHVELGDLINTGVIGLIDAAEKFDSSFKVKFKTYAEFRIKGAILDELRKMDWVPRSVRQKASRIEKALMALKHQLGRVPSDNETAEWLELSLGDYQQMLKEVGVIRLVSFDEPNSDNDGEAECSLADSIADPNAPDPAEIIYQEQLLQILGNSVDRLPKKERMVISLYYLEELTMKEIGEVLNLTESRVSQIHTKAILRLRGYSHQQLNESHDPTTRKEVSLMSKPEGFVVLDGTKYDYDSAAQIPVIFLLPWIKGKVPLWQAAWRKTKKQLPDAILVLGDILNSTAVELKETISAPYIQALMARLLLEFGCRFKTDNRSPDGDPKKVIEKAGLSEKEYEWQSLDWAMAKSEFIGRLELYNPTKAVRQHQPELPARPVRQPQDEKLDPPPDEPPDEPSEFRPRRKPAVIFGSDTTVGAAFPYQTRKALEQVGFWTLGHIARCTEKEFLARYPTKRPNLTLENVREKLAQAGLKFVAEISAPTPPADPAATVFHQSPDGNGHQKGRDVMTRLSEVFSYAFATKLKKAGIGSLEELAQMTRREFERKFGSHGKTMRAVKNAFDDHDLKFADNVTTSQVETEPPRQNKVPTPLAKKTPAINAITSPSNGDGKESTLAAVANLLTAVMKNAREVTTHVDLGNSTLDVTFKNKNELVPV